MEIAHVFNEIEKNNSIEKRYIPAQEFSISYILDKDRSNYNPEKLDDLKDDFTKKYYHALMPLDDKSIISNYDDAKLKSIVEKLGNQLVLISGDFWGIQKFIFDSLTSKKAPKIIRSRSAMVQLITHVVIKIIKEKFVRSEVLLFGAGKFLIIASEEDKYIDKINEIQKELNSYFLQNFFGQNGFILSTAVTTSSKILNQGNQQIKLDLESLGNDNDLKKSHKFDLLNLCENEVVFNPFSNANSDDVICEFCNKRIKTHNIDDTQTCEICFNQIELGKQLVKNDYVEIFSTQKVESKENIKLLTFQNKHYYAKFSNEINDIDKKSDIFDIGEGEYFKHPKWSLKSYVAMDNNNEIKTFSDYVEKDGKTFSSGLMALKADIDKLGDTFRKFYQNDFRKFNRLSREVEFFFSDYITSLVKKYNNVYTVFAGGDDLFLIGEYQEIIRLSKEIRDEFYKFSLQKTTISMGLVMFKPSTPINFVSELADAAEKRAKAVTDKNGNDRNGIDIFGISMKYDEFIDIETKFQEVIKYLESQKVDTTTFYYRLIELCDMKENINKNIRNAMWRSKLNYLFQRNIKKENNDTKIFDTVSELIERGEKFKPSIFLKIYQNRDNKKEQNNESI